MSNLDVSFDKYWQTREDVYTKALEQGGMSAEEARTNLNGIFNGRKELYRVITNAIGQRLDEHPPAELLDLFSGMATVPWSLQIGGKVSEVTIVDNDEGVGAIKHLNQLIAQGLNMPSPTFINSPIGIGFHRAKLPSIRQVTLINSGLGLPMDDRETKEGEAYDYAEQHGFDAAWEHYPYALARPHVHNVDIAPVLHDLRHAQRRIFIADRTKQHASRAVEATREHLEATISLLDGKWDIEGIKQLDDQGTVLAELHHS